MKPVLLFISTVLVLIVIVGLTMIYPKQTIITVCGLLVVVDTLERLNLKKDIRVITSGKIITGFDIFNALCLGADVCNSARGMMVFRLYSSVGMS